MCCRCRSCVGSWGSARRRFTNDMEVLRPRRFDEGPDEGAGSGECPAQEDVCRGAAQGRHSEGVPGKKVTRPSRRREVAKEVVSQRGISISLACDIFQVSETCYRYSAKKNAEDEEIADWLMRLTDNHRNWGFGLCFLYLRNVKAFAWNHKRVYRICWELELNLRIKPRKRLVRKRPEPLAVPTAINQVWSMDFMHDQLEDGRCFRLFNVIDDFNQPGSTGHRDRFLLAGRAGDPSAGTDHRMARQAGGDSLRQRPREYQRLGSTLGREADDQDELHPAGQASAECLCRALQLDGTLRVAIPVLLSGSR